MEESSRILKTGVETNFGVEDNVYTMSVWILLLMQEVVTGWDEQNVQRRDIRVQIL